ncbi:MAG TPA: GTPase domain-containing protein [Polyangium sp.]|nr:GTPase domain-containing protein [Polyangium sp.]
MSLMVILGLVLLVLSAMVGALVFMGMKAARLDQSLAESETKIRTLEDATQALTLQLEQSQKEAAHYQEKLAARPESRRKTYRIVALGMKGTGKTSLTLKWANPLADLGAIDGTRSEQYERNISRVQAGREVVEHVFEVLDWGGEHMVDAVQEISTSEVHGLLFVVDLGTKDAKVVEVDRVLAQLREFQPESLRYFFVPKLMANCKTIVLFINKSDLIPGTPSQIEQEARRLFQPLITNLAKQANPIELKVFVGSANSGHSTHVLFAHFVEKILPQDAYDQQLLQRFKSSQERSRSIPLMALLAPPLPPDDALGEAPSFMPKPNVRLFTLRGPGDTAAFMQVAKGKGKEKDVA